MPMRQNEFSADQTGWNGRSRGRRSDPQARAFGRLGRGEPVDHDETRIRIAPVRSRRQVQWRETRIGRENRPQQLGRIRVDRDSERLGRRQLQRHAVVRRHRVGWRQTRFDPARGRGSNVEGERDLGQRREGDATRSGLRSAVTDRHLRDSWLGSVIADRKRRLPVRRFAGYALQGRPCKPGVDWRRGDRHVTEVGRDLQSRRIGREAGRTDVDDLARLARLQFLRLPRERQRLLHIECARAGQRCADGRFEFTPIGFEARRRQSFCARPDHHHPILRRQSPHPAQGRTARLRGQISTARRSAHPGRSVEQQHMVASAQDARAPPRLGDGQ